MKDALIIVDMQNDYLLSPALSESESPELCNSLHSAGSV